MSVIVVVGVVPVSLNMCRFDMIFSAVFVLLYFYFGYWSRSYCSSSFHKSVQFESVRSLIKSLLIFFKLNFFSFFSHSHRVTYILICTFSSSNSVLLTFYNVCVRNKVYSFFFLSLYYALEINRNSVLFSCWKFFLGLKINTPVNSDYNLLGLVFSSLLRSLRTYYFTSDETWNENENEIQKEVCAYLSSFFERENKNESKKRETNPCQLFISL